MKIIFIIILSIFSFTITNAKELPVEVTADSYLLLNLDEDRIMYGKNEDKEEILASLTKIMTAYVIIKNQDNLDKFVTITEDDISELWVYTCIGLEVGNKVTYRDLLYGTLLESGADAAKSLANHFAGNVESFVKIMNKEAQNLGLHHTHFEDPYGGEDENVSTARELAYLLKTALKNETFKKIFETTQKRISNGDTVINYTRSIATFHGLDDTLLKGNKSGYTDAAGLLLASTAEINDTNYMLVVMKSKINPYMSSNVLDTYAIYDYLKTLKFNNYNILPAGKLLKTIPVEKSTIDEYSVYLEDDINLSLTEEEYKNLKTDIHIVDKLNPLNKKGDNIGYIDILLGDEIVHTHNLYLEENIPKIKAQTTIKIFIFISLLCLIVIIFLLTIPKRKRKKIKLIVKK